MRGPGAGRAPKGLHRLQVVTSPPCRRDALRRRGIKPRDHARENMRSIREAERVRRERREQGAENESPAQRFKMKRFQAAESKFRQAAQQTTPPEGSRRQFLKRSSQPGPPPLPKQPHVPRREAVKPAVPRVTEAAAPVRASAAASRPRRVLGAERAD